MKLKIGIFLSLTVLAACIVGFALPWYDIRVDHVFGDDQNKATFKWQNYVCEDTGDSDSKTTIKYTENGSCLPIITLNKLSEVAKIMNTCLSFLTIGAALALGTALLQLVIFLSPKLCRSCVWKLLCIGCSIASIVTLFISFFTIFGLPKAFDDDSNGINICQDRWCDKIYGSDDDTKWMPGGGWFATLVACFLALCSGIFTLASHR
ncbi:transmembrane protein [Heterostelium album PN500]|uniref:Transmembrane protein n=1 Tax=Heterostelium pallidum (strain ATCC 26659 / Pp 5 / PN500) TaxID=670386 RepID=D3BM13_HETP5|nr:transmembrane protein [Heterostelium album PN500]EFA77614.1 transmembrane protein [Heterostelium album PN500]|eukprot:XP_020429742.1 transmembrane protein [Heterostelium album PN500]